MTTASPLALLAELTHRCPLRCPYCSNPRALVAGTDEIETPAWRRVLAEAAKLGVLQVHFSGGEPAVRKDLEGLVAAAAGIGLYTNLITSGLLLDAARIETLARLGLDHLQLSIQDTEAGNADRIAGYGGGHAHKIGLARIVREVGLALTLNVVVHRQNLDRLEAMIELAVTLGAHRLELAHAQYHGWALLNRAALMPTPAQVAAAVETVTAARARLAGALTIDHVVPDYYARRPKPCMGGWGRRFIIVTPAGTVLPCHAAATLPGFRFDNVSRRPLAEIWFEGEAFRRFRGTDWMPALCKECPERTLDWGGCRCQAFALTGAADATDPVCDRSPLNAEIRALARAEASSHPPPLVYRGRKDGESRLPCRIHAD